MERSGLDPGRDGEPARWSVLGLEPRPDAVARVRRAARAVLRLWGRDTQEPAMSLLVSEVVTNAVRHARTAFDVTLTMDGDTVRCEVRDDSPVVPRPGRPGPDEGGGRGLLLVASLSTAWGVELHAPGKRVWFELPSVAADRGRPSDGAHVDGDPARSAGVHGDLSLVQGSGVADTAPPHPAVVTLPAARSLDLRGRTLCEPPLP